MDRTREEDMAPVTTHLLKSVSRHLSRVPTDPSDLAVAAAQLTSQLDGLDRLDELDLLGVEPATALLPPVEGHHANG
jgi:Asp-tRNA(Asn)/Glu-tRNA(Gln) amidotransferase C subunit